MIAYRKLSTACSIAMSAALAAGLGSSLFSTRVLADDAPAIQALKDAGELDPAPSGAATLDAGAQVLDDRDAVAVQPVQLASNDIPSDSAVTHDRQQPGQVSQTSANEVTSQGSSAGLWANYFGILYGPSLGQPTALQPWGDGTQDPPNPVLVKNYGTLGYSFNDAWALSASAYWHWYPTQGQNMVMQDPFLRISNAQILHNDNGMYLYTDLRFHFAVTHASRQADLLTGFQSFQVFNYPLGATRLTLGARASERYNVFGKQGVGNDVELYFAPAAQYQITPTISFTTLYEVGANHGFGDKPLSYFNSGTDLEPGIEWDPTPNFMLNPYINLTTGEKVSWKSSSIGMLLSWSFL